MNKLMKLKLLQTLYWDYDWDEWRDCKDDFFDGDVLRKNSILNVYNFEEWNGEADPNYKYVGVANNSGILIFFEDYEDILSCNFFKVVENNIK